MSGRLGHSAEFLFDYGKALRHNGLYGESCEVLARGLERSSDPMFLNLMGRNMEDMGRSGDAAGYYRRAANRGLGRTVSRQRCVHEILQAGNGGRAQGNVACDRSDEG